MSLRLTLDFITNHPLSKGQKGAAILNYIKWQIGSRLIPGEVAYEWVNGTRLLAKKGETGVTGNIYCGLQEFSEMAFVLHASSTDDVFVDVGANVGAYTVLACGAKGARGYCFEPVPTTYERLLRNIRLNNLSARVSPFNIGLSDQSGELTFTTDENCTNHVITDSETKGNVTRVKVSTLDEALQGICPYLMKIDVEGFETPVVNGAHTILSNPVLHAVVMELNGSGNRYGFNEQLILDKMEGYGFSSCSYDPFSRKLTRINGANDFSGNTLFIRDEDSVHRKVMDARRTLVNGKEI